MVNIPDDVWIWLNSDETGMSSKTILQTLEPIEGLSMQWFGFYPEDPSDFSRCKNLLEKIPRLKPLLPKLIERFPYWKPFVDNWNKMEEMFNEEEPSGAAPKLYAFMKKLEKQAEAIQNLK